MEEYCNVSQTLTQQVASKVHDSHSPLSCELIDLISGCKETPVQPNPNRSSFISIRRRPHTLLIENKLIICYNCIYNGCKRNFKTKGNLKVHLQSHEQKRLFYY